MIRIYIPRDMAAVAVGADRLADAIAAEAKTRSLPITIIRNGSRGLFWLEPLMEVESKDGRIGYANVTLADIPSLFTARFYEGLPHARCVGPVERIPYLARQTRFTFARAGVIDPFSLADYRQHGGYRGLEVALSCGSEGILTALKESGLRGRGGAGFPTGVKWETVARASAPQKYIVCNADEGDSGSFADRMVMEGDPFMLIEGMTIAGLAVGATRGYIYIRSEYPYAITTMRHAITQAERAGLLGRGIAGSSYEFTLEVRVGAGAYVCGEETALLESLEGRRGQVRAKPPLPALQGLFNCPTVINNTISLASVPFILAEGARRYADIGFGRSRGTMPVQLAGNVRYGGLFECAFGVTLGELVTEIGGSTASGRTLRAVQAGGPLGAYFPPALFDTPYDYEAFAKQGGLIGHGGLVLFDDTVDMAGMARFAMAFCALESCGKCTPCRLGAVRGVETFDQLRAGIEPEKNRALIRDLCETMKFGSLCALGGFTPYPVLSAMDHFPEDFQTNNLTASAE